MFSFGDFKAVSLNVTISESALTRSGLGTQNVYHARVVDFSGGKAILDIDGRTVTAESEVPLKLNSEFDLVVKGFDQGGRVQLSITGLQESESAPVRPLSNEMIASRLRGFDLPEHTATVDSARALMRLGVAVTKANMEAMLSALPQNADKNTIDFAASLIKEELPLSRELIQMLPTITRDLEAMPETMKAAIETVIKAVEVQSTVVSDTAEASAEEVAMPTPRSFDESISSLSAPNGEDVEAIMDKLPNFIRGFLNSTEARLQALTDVNILENPGGVARSSFIDNLLTILKIVSQTPPQDPAQIQRAIMSIIGQVNNLQFTGEEAATLEQLRAALNGNISQAMALKDPAAGMDAIRTAVGQILAQAIEAVSASPAAPQNLSYPSIFDAALKSLAADIQNAAGDLQRIIQQLQQFQASQKDAAANGSRVEVPAPFEGQVLAVVSRMIPLLSFKFDSEATPQLAEFLDAASKWVQQAVKETGADTNMTNIALRLNANPDSAAAAQRILSVIENPAFSREIEFLVRHFSDLPDLRMALSRAENIADIHSQAIRDLSQGLQSANVANLVRHTGVTQMDSLVTFFPIQIGDRVEIGKMKIYRRDDDVADKKKSIKPLNPFDSRLVLILDTEFLGLTSIELRTFPNKGIKCNIEVQDNRRRKIVEKYLDELREGLKKTAYEQNTVGVSVRRRKTGGGSDEEPPDFHQLAAVDMRI